MNSPKNTWSNPSQANLYDMADYSSSLVSHDKMNTNGNGGGRNMDDRYATKQELKILETKIDGQFNTLNAKLDGQFKLNDKDFKDQKEQISDLKNQLKTAMTWFLGILGSVIGALILAGLKKVFIG